MSASPNAGEFEKAYAAGESNLQADWEIALSEYCDLPEDVEPVPTQVARYIARLQAPAAATYRCPYCGEEFADEDECFAWGHLDDADRTTASRVKPDEGQ